MRVFLLMLLFFSSCASNKRTLRPLSESHKPKAYDSSSMTSSMVDLENALNSASSRAERIKLLIEAIE